MSIDALLKLFENYGWPGIMAIVMIIVIYYFITKKDKQSQKTIEKGFVDLTHNIGEQNKALVEAIRSTSEHTQTRLFDLISKTIDDKETTKKVHHKMSIAKRYEIGEHVDAILFDLLQITNAQRVAMLEFHNSKENLDGLAFMWYDIQHEKQQKGVSSLSSKAKNLQATNIRPIIKRVNNSKSHIITLNSSDIDAIYKESTVLYSQLKEISCSNIIYCGIYNTDTNDLIGLIAIEYQEGHPYYPDLVDEYVVKEKAALIEHLYNQARKDMEGR